MTSAARPISGTVIRLCSAFLAAAALAATAQPASAPAAASAAAGPGSGTASQAAAAAPVASGSPLPAAPTGAARPDPARGGAIATAVCSACHAADGNRGTPVNPIIAGQHADYLVKQLVEFKGDVRPSPIMKPMASALSEADMRNVAAFYASKSARNGFARDKELAALGEKIWRGGIPGKGVPACAGCHGPAGAGIPAQYPKLGGQHADYLEAQLVAFRGRARANNVPMLDIAAKLSDREIKAVADYSAGLR